MLMIMRFKIYIGVSDVEVNRSQSVVARHVRDSEYPHRGKHLARLRLQTWRPGSVHLRLHSCLREELVH